MAVQRVVERVVERVPEKVEVLVDTMDMRLVDSLVAHSEMEEAAWWAVQKVPVMVNCLAGH